MQLFSQPLWGSTRQNTYYTGLNEPHHDKTNKKVCAPSEDSDQHGHPPSLIGLFDVRMKKADAQADLSLRWAHSHSVGFVMRRFKCETEKEYTEPKMLEYSRLGPIRYVYEK